MVTVCVESKFLFKKTKNELTEQMCKQLTQFYLHNSKEVVENLFFHQKIFQFDPVESDSGLQRNEKQRNW